MPVKINDHTHKQGKRLQCVRQDVQTSLWMLEFKVHFSPVSKSNHKHGQQKMC